METGCAGGMFSCSGGTCSPRAGCEPDPAGTAGSAYLGSSAPLRRESWDYHNTAVFSGMSVNTFPTCSWSSGSPTCSFLSAPGNFSSGLAGGVKLRSGTYTAKYVLLTDHYSSVGATRLGSFQVTAAAKSDGNEGTANGCDSTSGHKGAVDVNVVLVGDQNVIDSHTDKGKQNLNALFQHVYDQLSTSNATTVGIRLGKITVYEWSCEAGGEGYANVEDYYQMFQTGSSLLPAETSGKALNVFLTSTIGGNTAYLGLSGGLSGPPKNGTTGSGLVFASFNKLSNFNASCLGTGACAVTDQDFDFIDMGGTISHEIGHYLGLNHLSEREGTEHDPVPDSPECNFKFPTSYGIGVNSCRSVSNTSVYAPTGLTCSQACASYNGTTSFCPNALECQFNHVMWYTTKNYGSGGTGDGNHFSTYSGDILNLHPLVR